MSSVSQFKNNLSWWIYCSYTLHIIFVLKPKSLSFPCYHSLSFVFIRCTTCCHSLSFFITRCINHYHLLSFVVTRCNSLLLIVLLIVTGCQCCNRCSTRCHSLSLDAPLVCLFITGRFYKTDSENSNSQFCNTMCSNLFSLFQSARVTAKLKTLTDNFFFQQLLIHFNIW